MPPLEFKGGKKSVTQQQKVNDSSDDDMPPLEYLGTSSSKDKSAAKSQKSSQDDHIVKDSDSEDSMPPLESKRPTSKGTSLGDNQKKKGPHAKAKPKAKVTSSKEDDSDDSVPPLEGETLQTGDKVQLKGLSTKELNGAKGIIVSVADMKKSGRVTILLDSNGKQIAIKRENVDKLVQDEDDDTDESLPPLQHTGKSRAAPAAAKPCTDAKAELGARGMDFQVGDAVVLKGLSRTELNGERANVVPAKGHAKPGYITVKLHSGKQLALKCENLEKASAKEANDSEDELSPLEAVTKAAAKSKSDKASKGKKAAAKPKAAKEAAPETFNEGDVVILKDLQKQADLNGRKGTVVPCKKGNEKEDRLAIKLHDTGKTLSIRILNMTKAPPEVEVASANKSIPPSDKPKSSPVTCESLLERMREVKESSSLREINAVIEEVESNEALNWGDTSKTKRALLKKLRERTRKLKQVDPDPPRSDISGDSKPSSTDGKWVVVDQPESGKEGGLGEDAVLVESQLPQQKQSPLMVWCSKHNLPTELVERLIEEDVTDPRDLVELPEDELLPLVKGLSIGVKGRFMKAVKALR